MSNMWPHANERYGCPCVHCKCEEWNIVVNIVLFQGSTLLIVFQRVNIVSFFGGSIIPFTVQCPIQFWIFIINNSFLYYTPMLCVAELVTLDNMAIASLVTLCPNELYAKQILQTRETCWKFYKNRKQNSNLHKH